MAPLLPHGTVAFLFTDIEGSTRLWQEHPAAMSAAYARHDAILGAAVARAGGARYKVVGDAFQIAFHTAAAAVAAALEAQRALVSEDWLALGLPEPLRVRMALHVGAVDPDQDGDYRAPALNRLGRLLGAGHGGQILLSEAARSLARGHLPEDAGFLELGAQRLKDLLEPEPIWQLVHPDLPRDFPPLATLDQRRHNLPLQPTPLIGREREVAASVDLLRLQDVRLLTLTGAGGTGKTRLALQAASELTDEFPDGVWFVPLAPLSDPDLVPAAIARALAVHESGGRSLLEALAEHLARRRLLLVLDNFEHLLPAATVVGELLAAAPGLTILATSRAPLRLRAEHERLVPVLSLPRRKPPPTLDQVSQFEAVRLFIARAVSVKADFAITNETAPAVAEICHRLDGLPLAIELAAARVRLLPPQAMLARLEQRLPLLTGGARDAPARQQTLRNAIAWSYDLLEPDEQKLFRRLSVFAGGWTLDAAEAVAGSLASGELTLDVFDGLERLVTHSLVRQSDGLDGAPRFTMLETVREYGVEQLTAAGEADEALDRLATQMAAEVDREVHAIQNGRVDGISVLSAEFDNIRVALDWLFAQSSSEPAARLAASLAWFWELNGDWTEGHTWLQRALTRLDDISEPQQAALLLGVGILETRLGHPSATSYLHRSVERAGVSRSHITMAYAISYLGVNAAVQHNDLDESIVCFQKALDIFREESFPTGVIGMLNNLALSMMYQQEYDRSRRLFEEALELSNQHEATWAELQVIGNLGCLHLETGNLAQAERLLTTSLAQSWEHKLLDHSCDVIVGLARLSIARQRYEHAALLFGIMANMEQLLGVDRSSRVDLDKMNQALIELRARLPESTLSAAIETGRAMPLNDAIAEALRSSDPASSSGGANAESRASDE